MSQNTSGTAVAPRIYVACLASYNAGILHGAWIDASQDVDGIREGIAAMLATSPEHGAEEYAIHDYEGFGDYHVSEYESIEDIVHIAALMDEHGDAFTAALSWRGDVDEAAQVFEDGDYCGEYSSEEDFAEELFDECYLHEIPESVRSYIDYEKFAHDLYMTDYASVNACNGNVHIFRNS